MGHPGILSIPGSMDPLVMGHPRMVPGIRSIPGSTGSPGMGHPGWSQESRDTKYSGIHGSPWHGTSRDYPRNPGILSTPGSTGSPVMGHPRIIPGIMIPGYPKTTWDKLWQYQTCVTCTHTCTHTHACTHMHAHTHIYPHIHTHTHTHTLTTHLPAAVLGSLPL